MVSENARKFLQSKKNEVKLAEVVEKHLDDIEFLRSQGLVWAAIKEFLEKEEKVELNLGSLKNTAYRALSKKKSQ